MYPKQAAFITKDVDWVPWLFGVEPRVDGSSTVLASNPYTVEYCFPKRKTHTILVLIGDKDGKHLEPSAFVKILSRAKHYLLRFIFTVGALKLLTNASCSG